MKLEPVFQVRALTRHHGGGRGVFDATFDLLCGECVALVGPNGAGKTTLLETALGLHEPDSGDCFVCGFSLRSDRAEYLRHLGGQLQEEAHLPHLTVAETLALHTAYAANTPAVDAVLRGLGLDVWAHARMGALSSGLRQRVSVALAFVARPDVVLLDEPTAGLDSEARAAFAALVREACDSGAAVLFSTHLDEDAAFAHRTLKLRDGRWEEGA